MKSQIKATVFSEFSEILPYLGGDLRELPPPIRHKLFHPLRRDIVAEKVLGEISVKLGGKPLLLDQILRGVQGDNSRDSVTDWLVSVGITVVQAFQ